MKINRFTLRHIIYLKHILLTFYKDKLYWSFFAATVFATIIYSINYFFYPSNFWDSFTIQKGMDVWFCEFTDMKKVIRQPINTFTNIWYIVNAIFFLSKGFSDYRKPNSFNLITANPFYSILLGFISIYTFLCSTFFHSSLIAIASKFDFSAVYSISLFPLMYYTHRITLLMRNKSTHIKHPIEVRVIVLVFTIIYLLLTFLVPLSYVHPIVLTFIILAGLGGLYLEKKDTNKSNSFYLLLMTIFIIIAVVLFKMDTAKIACDPDSFIQPHSLWHIFNSMTVFYIYLYFRSENYQEHKDEKVLRIKKMIR
jgi:hypothetical protein